MFCSEYEHTLDTKGRVFIPARHREELGETVFIGRGMDGQLNVYPKAVWEDMAGRLAQANQARPTIRNASRFVFSATEYELDRQGRVLISASLRRFADLGSDVVILGNNDHVEIWSRERWQETCDRVLAQGRDSSDDTTKLSELALSL
ncbi:MAG: division/cell wall cluster transcriptional repressor MraZ [Chloroflexi bacterium HGW-Chloroflexi-1]|nr:MAG: division/cell wall cluster transcriptional repressor MraZ [Chloroflexi bacterium HGW-Chloroflexi-1]